MSLVQVNLFDRYKTQFAKHCMYNLTIQQGFLFEDKRLQYTDTSMHTLNLI